MGRAVSPKVIGLLGGTFDPPHFGHLNLALEVLEKCNLDEIWLTPALVSPFKTHQQCSPYKKRVEMLELLVQGVKRVVVSHVEETLSVPSYTYNTLQYLRERYPHQFYLVLADEALEHFHRWKRAQWIVEEFPMLLGTRFPQDIKTKIQQLPFEEHLKDKLKNSLLKTRLIEVSSSELRERIKKKTS